LLAIGFSPLVRFLERQRVLRIGTRRLPRWLAILIVYLVFLGVIAGIAAIVLPPMLTQARELAANLPSIAGRVQQALVRRGLMAQRMSVSEIVQQGPAATDVVGTMLLTFWGVIGGLIGAFTILILTFYLLVDSESTFEAFLRLVPLRRRDRVRAISREITNKVSAWLTGQLILAATIGTTAAIGLGLLGVPYFYVLALIAGVGEMIPYIGPLLAAVPALGVALSISWQLAVAVGVYYFLQQQLEASFLVPKLMERQVGLSAVAVLIAILLGSSLLGVPGAILAVPTTAIAQVLFYELTGPPPGREAARQ
jgi:predicted PurR-regulated permease PerM